MDSINTIVQNYFTFNRTPQITEFMYSITSTFDFTISYLLIVVCISILIYRTKSIKDMSLFLFTVFSTAGIVYVLKHIFSTTRPENGIIEVSGGSFPSYHATIAIVFFVILNYIFYERLNKKQRILVVSLSTTVASLVAFSRIYLGVHWLSDVVFGIILGILISLLAIVIFRKYNRVL